MIGRTLCLLLLALAAACSSRPPDRAGEPRPRIISLVPAATEMLFAMGAGDNVVAVSTFDRYPPQVDDLPKVGALVDPDFERILTLNPTLVVVYASQEDLIARLERASIAIHPYRHAVQDGLRDIAVAMRTLGDRVGHGAAARTEADRIERDLADIQARSIGARHPDTALVIGRESGSLSGMYVSGGVGFLHELLEVAGGRNVFEDVRRENLQVSTEMILARAPDVIIELRSGPLPDQAVASERAVWNRLASLPAVRRDRVYVLPDESLSIPGPRIAAAARVLFDVLQGEKR